MPVEFTCAGCGRTTIQVIRATIPDPPYCGGCELFGPVAGKALQDWQDGRISSRAFAKICEEYPAPRRQSIDQGAWRDGKHEH